ncbi:MAG: hypothetical protein PHT95_05930 [Candidatus Omnitrophica bacterium]|jgi:hypothetical protein|nr:hypothetical protein [Candidatus Omnitrophota bacterium]
MSYSKVVEELSVTTAASSVELDVDEGACIAYIEVENTGSVALSAFKLYRQSTPQSDYELLAEVDADYVTPLLPIMETSGSPVTLGAAGFWYVRLDVRGCAGLKITATTASGSTTLGIKVKYSGHAGR